VGIGKVASAAAGDEDFAARLRIALEEQDSAVALSGDGGTHEAGSTCTEDDDVEFASGNHFSILAELAVARAE